MRTSLCLVSVAIISWLLSMSDVHSAQDKIDQKSVLAGRGAVFFVRAVKAAKYEPTSVSGMSTLPVGHICVLSLPSGSVTVISGTAIPAADLSVSRDASYVVFTSVREGKCFIARLNIASGAVIALTDEDQNAFQPVCSPDGMWIAFIKEEKDGQRPYVIRPDGSDVTLVGNWRRDTGPKVSAPPGQSRGAALTGIQALYWTKDSKTLYLRTKTHRKGAGENMTVTRLGMRVDIASGEIERIELPPYEGDLSPDGKKYVFADFGPSMHWQYEKRRIRALYIQDALDSGEKELLFDPAPTRREILHPAWSPDMRHVVFESSEVRRDPATFWHDVLGEGDLQHGGYVRNTDIWIVNLMSGEHSPLTTTEQYSELFPVWSEEPFGVKEDGEGGADVGEKGRETR